MDLERATLRTLFYDYPIEVAMRHIASFLRGEKDSFLSDFPQIIRWTESQYSVSELRLVGKLLEHEAKETRESIHPELLITQSGVFANAICMVPQIAERWLVFNNEHEMVVHFNEMFRWRDMTVLFGEDFFTTAYLAWTDLKNLNDICTSFEWPDVISHDNKVLDDILRRGLSEVHSHYYASTDVFHFNWLCLMNHIDYSDRITSVKGDLQERRTSLLAIEQIYKLKNICVAAAYLRCQLFRYVYAHESLDELKLCLVGKILSDDACCASESDKLQDIIAALGRFALCDNDNKILDYAITNDSEPLYNNIYIMYKGERQLLYRLYRHIFENGDNADDIAPYFYLYLLIKNFVRREIVETNQLLGFENFEIYQSRKSVFLKKEDSIAAHMPQFIYQMNTPNGDTVELRVTPGDLYNNIIAKHGAPVFDEQDDKEVEKKLSFVVHFIKDKKFVDKAENFTTRAEYWKHYTNQLKEHGEVLVLHYQKIREARKKGLHELPQFTGIDAASNELYCRPEIFGHVYRFAALEGILNRTYHVGEDFFDLIDGLRAIDEAIEFLRLDNNCRLGHVLALGTNALDYYTKRHYTTITFKQYLLDNIVWLYQKARSYNVKLNGIKDVVHRNALRLYNDIGYNQVEKCEMFDIDNYWDSMWLRSDDSLKQTVVKEEQDVMLLRDKWQQTVNYDGKHARFTGKNDIAKKIYKAYLTNKNVFSQGNEVEIFKWPTEIIEVVTQLQDKMIAEIAEKQIAIECNPSSNLKIGHFDRYDEHPIFRFRPIDKNIHTPLLNVSINTDDRGVFATSLYNEFSLIALALTKQRDKDGNRLYNDEAICEYIDHIRKNNLIQRFKID